MVYAAFGLISEYFFEKLQLENRNMLKNGCVYTWPCYSKVLPLRGEWQATEQAFRLKHIEKSFILRKEGFVS